MATLQSGSMGCSIGLERLASIAKKGSGASEVTLETIFAGVFRFGLPLFCLAPLKWPLPLSS